MQAQLDFLRKLAELHGWPVAGVYVDDGISGTLPLGDRPEGRRLLEDAQDGAFSAVLVYRLDRLGRKVQVLLDAHQQLEAHDVAIKSGTEPFDTSSPIGIFVFQLLGSIAELERSTIAERMTMGRDRVARDGKWLGVIPYGYDVDADGRLCPSTRVVERLGCTEAEVMADLYERIAAGSSVMAECRRLNALGMPVPPRRYPSGRVFAAPKTGWTAQSLTHTLHNTVYAGRHVLNSKHGPVEREVPALVAPALWQAVQAQLTRNRRLARKNAKRDYLLRGLVFCEGCGSAYAGLAKARAAGREIWYYRCTTSIFHQAGVPRAAHAARSVPAEWLERLVWADCRHWAEHPGEVIAEAQAQLRARLAQAPNSAAERRRLRQQQAEQAAEREPVLTLYRRNRLTLAEVEGQLDAIDTEAQVTAGLLQALDSQLALTEAAEAQLTEVATLLGALREEIAEIEATEDRARMRQIIELLVTRIAVRTHGAGRAMNAEVTITYAFTPRRSVVTGSEWCSK